MRIYSPIMNAVYFVQPAYGKGYQREEIYPKRYLLGEGTCYGEDTEGNEFFLCESPDGELLAVFF